MTGFNEFLCMGDQSGGGGGSDGVSTAQFQVLQNQPTYLTNGSLGAVYGQRLATYTGGAVSDASATVCGAVRGYTQAQSQVTYAVETGGLFVTDNYSNHCQAVGVVGQGNSRHGGRVWGGVFEGHELPETFTATASQTSFTIPNGYSPGTAVVRKNGALLTRTTNYVDSSGTSIVLTTAATAGDIIEVWRGNPLQANIGAEIDVFAGPGSDTVNANTGNRVIAGLFGYRQDKTLNVATHVGTGLAIFADPSDSYLTIDRGICLKGQFGTAIDLSQASLTGSALQLASGQKITLGSQDLLTSSGNLAIGNLGTFDPAGYAALYLGKSTSGGIVRMDDGTNSLQLQTVSGGGVIDSSNAIVLKANGTEKFRTSTSGLSFYGASPASKPTVSGSRGGNAALASLISALATLGLITDSTSA